MRVLDRRTPRAVAQTGPSTAPLLPDTPATTSSTPAAPFTTRAEVPLITAGRGPGLGTPTTTGSTAAAYGAVRRAPAKHTSKHTNRHLEQLARQTWPGRAAAARRARVLLVLAMITLTSWAVVAVPQVPIWAAVPATGLLLTDVVVLMVSGRRRAARRRAEARVVASRIAVAQRRTVAAAKGRSTGATPSRRVVAPAVATVSSTSAPVVEAEASLTDAEGTSSRPAEPAVEDGTWTPVPVPRPTYMLKPVVHRPEPRPLDESVVDDPDASAPVATPPVEPAPRPWEVEHTWADDLDVVLARRRAVNG